MTDSRVVLVPRPPDAQSGRQIRSRGSARGLHVAFNGETVRGAPVPGQRVRALPRAKPLLGRQSPPGSPLVTTSRQNVLLATAVRRIVGSSPSFRSSATPNATRMPPRLPAVAPRVFIPDEALEIEGRASASNPFATELVANDEVPVGPRSPDELVRGHRRLLTKRRQVPKPPSGQGAVATAKKQVAVKEQRSAEDLQHLVDVSIDAIPLAQREQSAESVGDSAATVAEETDVDELVRGHRRLLTKRRQVPKPPSGQGAVATAKKQVAVKEQRSAEDLQHLVDVSIDAIPLAQREQSAESVGDSAATVAEETDVPPPAVALSVQPLEPHVAGRSDTADKSGDLPRTHADHDADAGSAEQAKERELLTRVPLVSSAPVLSSALPSAPTVRTATAEAQPQENDSSGFAHVFEFDGSSQAPRTGAHNGVAAGTIGVHVPANGRSVGGVKGWTKATPRASAHQSNHKQRQRKLVPLSSAADTVVGPSARVDVPQWWLELKSTVCGAAAAAPAAVAVAAPASAPAPAPPAAAGMPPLGTRVREFLDHVEERIAEVKGGILDKGTERRQELAKIVDGAGDAGFLVTVGQASEHLRTIAEWVQDPEIDQGWTKDTVLNLRADARLDANMLTTFLDELLSSDEELTDYRRMICEMLTARQQELRREISLLPVESAAVDTVGDHCNLIELAGVYVEQGRLGAVVELLSHLTQIARAEHENGLMVQEGPETCTATSDVDEIAAYINETVNRWQELQMDMLNADPTVFDRNEAHAAEAEAPPVGLGNYIVLGHRRLRSWATQLCGRKIDEDALSAAVAWMEEQGGVLVQLSKGAALSLVHGGLSTVERETDPDPGPYYRLLPPDGMRSPAGTVPETSARVGQPAAPHGLVRHPFARVGATEMPMAQPMLSPRLAASGASAAERAGHRAEQQLFRERAARQSELRSLDRAINDVYGAISQRSPRWQRRQTTGGFR